MKRKHLLLAVLVALTAPAAFAASDPPTAAVTQSAENTVAKETGSMYAYADNAKSVPPANALTAKNGTGGGFGDATALAIKVDKRAMINVGAGDSKTMLGGMTASPPIGVSREELAAAANIGLVGTGGVS